jgi:hypothetical protein
MQSAKLYSHPLGIFDLEAGLGSPPANRGGRLTLPPVISELRAAGVISMHGIAAALNVRGVPTPWGGRRWYANQVARMVKRLPV